MYARTIIIALVAILILASLSGCFAPSLTNFARGNGRMTDASFSYNGSITSIDIRNVRALLNITPEKSSEVTYTVDENVKDLIQILYQNGMLRITTRNNISIRSDGIIFNIGADALEKITVSGNAIIRGNGTFEVDSFIMDISGAVNAELALNAQRVKLNSSGSTEILFSGTADKLIIEGSGAAKANTRNLIAQDVSIELSGASTIQVYADRTLNVSISGTGSVTYWGEPVLSQSVAGTASIKIGD